MTDAQNDRSFTMGDSAMTRVTNAIARIRNRIAEIIAANDVGAYVAERDAARAETESIVAAVETFAGEIAPAPAEEPTEEPVDPPVDPPPSE